MRKIWSCVFGLGGALVLTMSCTNGSFTQGIDLTKQKMASPSAQGYGSDTEAGFNGSIIVVKTLAASGPGSLRAAIETRGPRVVVFEVGGTIDLGSQKLSIKEPYLTIAGQSAPSPGINLIGAGIQVETHDVLIQHLRVRVGDRSGKNLDGINVGSFGPETNQPVHHVIIDHCSFAWGIDENASISGTGKGAPHDVTYSNNIIAEGLSNSVHQKGEHSKGTLVHRGSKNILLIGNLYAHNRGRNPQLNYDTSSIIVNNLIYNPEKRAIFLNARIQDKKKPETFKNESLLITSTIEGNLVLGGSNTSPKLAVLMSQGKDFQIFQSNNEGLDRMAQPIPLVKQTQAQNLTFLKEKPIWLSTIQVKPINQVKDWVLANAGARPWDRDEVDSRIIDSVRKGSGQIIDSQNQVGGYPRLKSTQHQLQIPTSLSKNHDGDRYSRLKEWISSFSKLSHQ